jgi:glycosyltransferase involved in cell wall biosynthesis
MKSIAVLIPCYNEESTIVDVINSFRKYVPEAAIYVYDNNSSDRTAELARSAGASVKNVKDKGKGNVVRKMFSDVDADIILMVDGDSTYDASDSPKMIKLIQSSNKDMVVAVRKEISQTAYPQYHKIGNRLFNFMLKMMFRSTFTDAFSGYRAFSKRFVKTFPATTRGFDIEVELSIHALTLAIPFGEIESKYRERPTNSFSKLNTFRDGIKILLRILLLLKEIRPLFFSGLISLFSLLISQLMAYPLVIKFLDTGLVPRLPTVLLSMGFALIAFFSLLCGMILDSVSQARIETKKLHYLLF